MTPKKHDPVNQPGTIPHDRNTTPDWHSRLDGRMIDENIH